MRVISASSAKILILMMPLGIDTLEGGKILAVIHWKLLWFKGVQTEGESNTIKSRDG